MRLLISSLLLGMLLIASPARAFSPEQSINSRYNGSHYIVGDDHGPVAHRKSRHRSAHKHHVGRKHVRVSRARHVQRPTPKPAVKEFRADLSHFGKDFIVFGGLLIDTAANGGITLGTIIAETAHKIVSSFVVEPVKKTLSAAGKLIQFFLDRGYPRPAAYAIAGHIRAESNFNTRDVGDGGRARYLAQWHPDRQRGLKRLAARKGTTPYDYETNLEYIDHELRTSEGLAYRELHRAKSLDAAVAAFAHFERPRGYSAARPRRIHDWHTRLRFARQYAKDYGHIRPTIQIGGL